MGTAEKSKAKVNVLIWLPPVTGCIYKSVSMTKNGYGISEINRSQRGIWLGREKNHVGMHRRFLEPFVFLGVFFFPRLDKNKSVFIKEKKKKNEKKNKTDKKTTVQKLTSA